MKTRKLLLVSAAILIALVFFSGCEGLLAPSPSITKFEHADFSYGTTHDVDAGDVLSFTVNGEMPGGAGTLEVIADKDGTETVLLETEISTEEIALEGLRVLFDIQEEGKYEVFARATTTETAKIAESARINFDVSVISATGMYVRGYKVAEIGDTFEIFSRITPIGAPGEEVTYESSKPAVVAVSGSELSAVAGGIATITVTSVDSGFTGEAKVYVEPADADGGTTNPWVWDVKASDTTKTVSVDNFLDYYLVAVTGSALYMAYDGEANSTIAYEVRNGNQWLYGDAQGSGEVQESDSYQTIANDLEPGFYMISIERTDDTVSMDVDLNIYTN